jgi:hypothetical protein
VLSGAAAACSHKLIKKCHQRFVAAQFGDIAI